MRISGESFTVMEPVLHPEPFDDPDFIYQVKWDGVRILSFIKQNGVQLWNKRNHERSVQYPELQALDRQIKGWQAILDGEVVVLKNGKPSFPAVMRRDRSANQPTIEYMQKLLPIDYMVFDILSYEGKELLDYPLDYRQKLLADVLEPGERVHLVDNFSQGTGLFEAIKAQDLEGVVAKKPSSRYISGKHHKAWFKIKYRRQQNCVVGGYTLRGVTINSLLLGVFQDGRLMYCGKAGTGLNSAEWDELSRQLPHLEINASPFANLTEPGRGFHFVIPQLAVKVEFAEWSEDIQLRSPVIKGFVDLSPEACVLN
ncbi:MAG: non-homologous end-joining DNA ligase [Syntrophomonadaceae bacterium]|jgi:bifunctional non-homologous end joining protein LigD